MAWHTEGVKTNPAVDALMAETDPFETDGARFPQVYVSATVPAQAAFQHIDVDGTTILVQHDMIIGTGTTPLECGPGGVPVLEGQTFRILNKALIIGQVQGTIFA